MLLIELYLLLDVGRADLARIMHGYFSFHLLTFLGNISSMEFELVSEYYDKMYNL